MVKIEKILIRGQIRIRNLLGINDQDIKKQLNSTSLFALSNYTVDRWLKYFKAGGESLQDQRQSGR